MPDPASQPQSTVTPPGIEREGVTGLLSGASAGNPAALERLLEIVYSELRTIAAQRMSEERRAHTLQATALVHEAYLRVFGSGTPHFESRAHFFYAAAEAMRKILIDHARARNAQKRGGGKAALQIEGVADLIDTPNMDGFLSLDDAIVRLETVDAQAASVVRLRFYAGLGEAGVAGALGLSERTVRREWAFARAWLRDFLERDQHEPQQHRGPANDAAEPS
jgi:RNA polymerase sigma factor (TIGR02999 family)